MPETTIEDDDIQALVDNELPPLEEARIRQAIELNPTLSTRYRSLHHQKELLVTWWAYEIDRQH